MDLYEFVGFEPLSYVFHLIKANHPESVEQAGCTQSGGWKNLSATIPAGNYSIVISGGGHNAEVALRYVKWTDSACPRGEFTAN